MPLDPTSDQLTLPLSTSGAAAIDVAWQCARAGGALALASFRGDHAIDIKGHRNIVTETDVAAELRIIEILRAEYPDHAVPLRRDSG